MVFNLNKFNYFLHEISDPSSNISILNRQLMISKLPGSTEGSLKHRIMKVNKYIAFHADYLNPVNRKWIKKIYNKFSTEAKQKNKEIQKAIQPHLTKLEGFINPTETNVKKTLSAPSICLQVADAPKNKKEFENNLKLVLDHFPRYQFHNDLSIFDTAYKSMPKDWNFDEMHAALQAKFKKYKNIEKDSDLCILKKKTLHLLKKPVPIKMGIIIETKDKDEANPALLHEFMHLAKQKIPCLVNREFFQTQSKNFKNYPDLKLKEYDIYLQRGGNLTAVVPQGQSLEKWGFDPDSFKLSENEEYMKPSKHPLDFAHDIKSLLINETTKKRFFRLISFAGHGAYPGTWDASISEGFIGGVTETEFQKILLSLKKKNLAFLHLSSCMSGGTNSTSIHLPDGTIPCPIYIQSSFDILTHGEMNENTPYEYKFALILKKAEKMLFPHSFFSVTPAPLTKTDRNKLSSIINILNPAHKFTNLGTLLLPSNRNDIPKVTYTLAQKNEILDVSVAGKENRASCKVEEGFVLDDQNQELKAYLFSDPIVPFTLNVSGLLPMILLSRGGKSHHVIKQVIAPHQDIEDIAKETFNAFHSLHIEHDNEPASKVFYIAHLKCQFEGRDAELSRVTIINYKGIREVLFQLKGEEGFHRLVFNSKGLAKGFPWKKERSEIISLNDALTTLYLTAYSSAPSRKTLDQVTAGRQSKVDFIEALDHYFFPEPMPPIARLYSALLKDEETHPDLAIHLKQALSQLKKEFANRPVEKWNEVLRLAYDMAGILHLDDCQYYIVRESKTPLLLALEEGNKELMQIILKDNPQALEAVDCNGNTALSLALRMKKFEIAKWLIEQGANLEHINRFGYSAFHYVCCAKIEFIEGILQGKTNIRGDIGAEALVNLINAKKKDWKKIEFLIDHHVGEDSSKFSVFADAVSNSARVRIIEKLLQYPHVNINQQFADHKNTVLHFSIAKNDFNAFKLLLKNKADPNTKNSYQGTPLHSVSVFGQEKAVEFAQMLIQSGARINEQDAEGKTALHYAIIKQKKELIELLIRHGASLQLEDHYKKNPLEYAAECPELFEFILQIPSVNSNLKNSKVDTLSQQTTSKGNLNQSTDEGSPLFHALMTKNFRWVETLLSEKAPFKPPLEVKYINSPFHILAIQYEPNEMINMAKMFMDSDYKTSLNNRTSDGLITPLFYAIVLKKEKIANFLIKHGADINLANVKGISPLHKAISNLSLSFAIALINKGAEVKTSDVDGDTPLHEAVFCGTSLKEESLLDLIALLISKGAKWDIPNKEGITPKDLAIKLRMGKVVKLMQKA